MRKLLAVPIALCLLLGAACGGDDDSNAAQPVTDAGNATAGVTAPASPSTGDSATVSTARTPNLTASAGTAVPGTTSPPGTISAPVLPNASTPGATTAPRLPNASTPGATTPSQPTISAVQPTIAPTTRPASTATPSEPVGDATLSVTSASGGEGEIVEVVLSISAESNLQLGGWLVDVEYDASMARVDSCTSHEEGLCNQAFSANSVRFVGVSDGHTGELGRATFRLTGESGASAPLRITTRQCIDPVGAEIICGVSDGTLSVN